MQAETLQYSLDEDQWEQDWASILSLAGQPGTSLEQSHVFALAHILRRPVIIYGVKYVKSFRGEVLGLARFQGTFHLVYHALTQYNPTSVCMHCNTYYFLKKFLRYWRGDFFLTIKNFLICLSFPLFS